MIVKLVVWPGWKNWTRSCVVELKEGTPMKYDAVFCTLQISRLAPAAEVLLNLCCQGRIQPETRCFMILRIFTLGSFFLSSSIVFAFNFSQIITCNEPQDSSSRAIVIDKDLTPGAQETFQIVIKSQNLLQLFERCLALGDRTEYQTYADSPAYGVFIGETRMTSLGRGKNRARLVAEHFEDTSSVVLKCDYATGADGEPRWLAFERITLFDCKTYSGN